MAQIFCTHSFVYHRWSVTLLNDDDFKKHIKNLIQHHDMKNQVSGTRTPILKFETIYRLVVSFIFPEKKHVMPSE
jgi:hypothetical protein